ncbi:uncharacterized protein LOC101741688 [Bombyx mori]|uniref:Uncharacterized protein n=1 Tax=Bombyx mori TaxID=7091 RepID=A0A8R1WNT7_BOMMO|nr:uncharacterized protein LOC101741688 [Bombyx mori]
MTKFLSVCLAVCVFSGTSHGVSTKLNFSGEETSAVTNSSKAEDEDVEVKHTIIVSTKLRNNNRRGIHGFDDDRGVIKTLSYDNNNKRKDDSGEVPIIAGYKAVETTQIRAPDTRYKNTEYPESTLVNRNIRDQYDLYPSVAMNPSQWRPSSIYSNINWNQGVPYNIGRNADRAAYENKLHRRIAENSVKDFYCKKCMELSNGLGLGGCAQQINNWKQETTTTKIKLDGKLAKLN